MPISIDTAFSDYVVPGIPSSGIKKAVRAEQREALNNLSVNSLSGIENIKTASYTVLAADSGKTTIGNSANAIIFTMTAAAMLGTTFRTIIMNVGDGLLTVAANEGETINGEPAVILSKNETVWITSNGALLRALFLVPDGSITTSKISNKVYAIPNSPTADLRTFMDKEYGEEEWTYRTGVGVGTDAGPAITSAFLALRERYGRGKLLMPPSIEGPWLVTNPPSLADCSGHSVEGWGSQASLVVLNNPNSSLFKFGGVGGYTGGGVKGLGIFLEAGFGTTANASAIYMQGDSSFQPDQTELNDLYITQIDPASYWFRGIHAVGTQRTTPQGLRVGQWSNLQIFGCRNMGAAFYNVVKLCVSNLGVYAGTGTGGDVFIGGGGAALTNTDQLRIDQLNCNILNATNATGCQINGKIGQLVTGISFSIYDLWLDVSAAQSGTLGVGRSLQL